MDTEAQLLRALEVDPHDEATRQAYADWLEEKGDSRAEFLRLQVALKSLPLGWPENAHAQRRLRELRRGCTEAWLQTVEPLSLLGELCVRTRSILKRLRIPTLGQVHDRAAAELLPRRSFGDTPLTGLRCKLVALGLGLEDGP